MGFMALQNQTTCGRDEMRGFGGRVGFITFARTFTGSFCVFACVCWFVFGLVLFGGFCLFCFLYAGERLLQVIPVSHLFAIPQKLTDSHPCP